MASKKIRIPLLWNYKELLMKNNNTSFQQERNFWAWLVIIFNRVDEDRLKLVGPNRLCAEWLLRNGGAVKFVGEKEFLDNYNGLLPVEMTTRQQIEEIDATGSSISHHGFDHLKGCMSVRKIILKKCFYLENAGVPKLELVKNSLKDLEITNCGNISDKGISSLGILSNLQKLVLSDLSGVKNLQSCVAELQKTLTNCQILAKP